MNDPIHSPAHYAVYPVQPIEISRHLGFCLGNAVKYVLRAPYKGGVEDCNKALKYLEWEEKTPGQDVSLRCFRLLGDRLDELLWHLRVVYSGACPRDNDIADIQAGFPAALKRYIEDADNGVETMRKRVRELVRAISGKAKGAV